MNMRISITSFLYVVMVACTCPGVGKGGTTCKVEQNGKQGKITCTVCPGDKNSFSDPITSDPSVVGIQSTTTYTTKVGDVTCGEQIVQVLKKKVGSATVTIDVKFGDDCEVKFDLCKDLFSLKVPGGVNFGEVGPSVIPPGQGRLVTFKIIDTVTDVNDPNATGSATVKLMNSTAFKFHGGGTSQTIQFVNGQATVDVDSVGPENETGFLEVTDDNSPDSVGGTDVLHTARISLLTGSSIPTVSQWGLIFMGLLLLTAGAIVIVRRRVRPI